MNFVRPGMATGGVGSFMSQVRGSFGASTSVDTSPAKSTRSRKKEGGKGEAAAVSEAEKDINASVKLAGYLNLMYAAALRYFKSRY